MLRGPRERRGRKPPRAFCQQRRTRGHSRCSSGRVCPDTSSNLPSAPASASRPRRWRRPLRLETVTRTVWTRHQLPAADARPVPEFTPLRFSGGRLLPPAASSGPRARSPALPPAPASAGSAGSALKRLVLVPGTPSPTCSGEHALSASARASSPHSSLRSAGPRAPAFSRLEPDPAASPATPWRPDPRSAFWPSASLTAQQLSAPPTSASAFLREGSRACGSPPAPLSSLVCGRWSPPSRPT